MSLFIGRLSSEVRKKDLQDLFERFGATKRCDIKGSFAFVTFEDERDAEDALAELNGKDLKGSRINVEWAKGSGRYEGPDRSRGRRSPADEKCYVCGERGHFARDCRSSRRRDDRRRRSRSRSPRRRSRSRSRDRRERSRSRDRDRDNKNGRDRSPSPKRRRRSHSRSPKRSRSRSKSPKRRERSLSPEKSSDAQKPSSPKPNDDTTN